MVLQLEAEGDNVMYCSAISTAPPTPTTRLRKAEEGVFESSSGSQSSSGSSEPSSPPQIPQVQSIEEFCALLKDWEAQNYYDIKTKYSKAIDGVQTPPLETPEDSLEDWEFRTFAFFIAFFKRWYAFYPSFKKQDGLEFTRRFAWLYHQNPAGLQFVTTFPGVEICRQFVTLNGMKMDDPASKSVAESWMAEIGERMKDFIVPEVGFRNFNEFFARKIKPEARPISRADDPAILCSPADSIVNMVVNDLTLHKSDIPVKTVELSLYNLLSGSDYAARFVGGSAMSCILMPDDYHRFHAPVAGKVVAATDDIAGGLFEFPDLPQFMNKGNVAGGQDCSAFERFRRGYVIIETEKFGYVGMVPVGLTSVGSVVLTEKFRDIGEGVPITKGEEIGYFQYGGSLCILLFEKGVFPSVRIPQGQMLGSLIEKTD